MYVYIQNGGSGAQSISQIFNLILRLTDAMYIGVLMSIFSSIENPEWYNFYQSIGYLATPLLAMAVTHLGYIFGLNNFKIFGNKPNKAKK